MKEFYYLKCINLMQINKEMRNNFKKMCKGQEEASHEYATQMVKSPFHSISTSLTISKIQNQITM